MSSADRTSIVSFVSWQPETWQHVALFIEPAHFRKFSKLGTSEFSRTFIVISLEGKTMSCLRGFDMRKAVLFKMPFTLDCMRA